MGDEKELLQTPLPGFLDDEPQKSQRGIIEETPKLPQDPFAEGASYQEPLAPGFKGDPSEDFKDANRKFNNTVDLLQSWNLDKEAIPFVWQVADRRGFDPVLGMDIKENHFNDQIKEVQLCEKIFANGNEQERVRYIPVGATYVGGGVGLLMLHQEIDQESNKLGNTFYITRYVVSQRIDGTSNNYVTTMKIKIQDRDLALGEEVNAITLAASRKFPFEIDRLTKRPKIDPNTGFPIRNYKIVPRLHFKMPYELHNNIREFVGTRRPDTKLLAESYSLIKKGRRIEEDDRV